jgi:DNA-binding winged helix-turn-helix (wHTH) protein
VRVAFGDFVFDADTREVLREGRALPVSPKAFELLELLIRERPKALAKEIVHAKLWPGVFVSDASLSNLVAELRAALGDDARQPRILRTVHRFGYAFIGESRGGPRVAVSEAAFRLIWETREIALEPGESILGRDKNAVAWVDDPSVSRHHARILVAAGRATLEDLGSKNGTFLNGDPVEGAVELSDGDQIQVGRAAMVLRILEVASSTQTASGLPPARAKRR